MKKQYYIPFLIVLSTAALLALYITPLAQAKPNEGTLTFVRDSKEVKLSPEITEAVKYDMLSYVQSAGYDLTLELGTEAYWNYSLNEEVSFHLVYETTRQVGILYTESVPAYEVLIACRSGDENRSIGCNAMLKNDQYYHVYTKFHHQAYYNLVCRPELKLEMFKETCKEFERLDEQNPNFLTTSYK